MIAISKRITNFHGNVKVVGDKSVSHRALIIASQAVGVSKIIGISNCEDINSTVRALRLCGVRIDYKNNEDILIYGVGTGGLSPPLDVIDCGNSGTTARLMIGLLSSYSFVSIFTGDTSLRSRPMARVMEPLDLMGARFTANNNLFPIAMQGTDQLLPIEYKLPVPSAQVKSAVLLAALNTRGETQVIETVPTRDHTEIMLKNFGAKISIDHSSQSVIALLGQSELYAQNIVIPGDFSAASFLIVAALIIPNSQICIRNVLINSHRTGLFDTLLEMGANISYSNHKMGEEVADITVSSSVLYGVDVPAERAARMIDEYPILSIAAACALGKTHMHGLTELKIKESNRLNAIFTGLSDCGVSTEVNNDDSFIIIGRGFDIIGGVTIKTFDDHRIAMSFLILGMVTKSPITIDNVHCISNSFPNFVSTVNHLGGGVESIIL